MTHIYERLFLECPYVRAREYLRDALGDAPQPPSPGVDREENVLVRYEQGRDPLHFDEPWHVHWAPEDGDPFPNFTGELTVRADEAFRGAILELCGDYSPPFGAMTQALDIVVGTKIAASTARSLLQQIGESMLARFRSEESSKV